MNPTATESEEKMFPKLKLHSVFAFIRASALNINNEGLICSHSARTYKGLDRRDIHTLKLNIQQTAGRFIFLLFIDMYVLIKNTHTHTNHESTCVIHGASKVQ